MIDTHSQIDFNRVAPSKLPFEAVNGIDHSTPFYLKLKYLLSKTTVDENMVSSLHRELETLIHSAFEKNDEAALLEVHKSLFMIYEINFLDPLAIPVNHLRSIWLITIQSKIEEAWMEKESQDLAMRLPGEKVLRDEGLLTDWFVKAADEKTKVEEAVARFLNEEATLEDFKKFILIDANLNYRFFDALVLALLHYSEEVKEELSHHFWDESGEGDRKMAHTRQFSESLNKLNLSQPNTPIWDDWRPFAGYNVYLLLGFNRRHYFKALGSLAMPELFDPGRDTAIINGLNRLNFQAEKDFSYYYAHIEGDEEHGPAWLSNVIMPAMRTNEHAAEECAFGGILRMKYMRLFNQYLVDTFKIHVG